MSGDGREDDASAIRAGATVAPGSRPEGPVVATVPDTFYLVRHGVTEANLGRERAAGENEPLLPAGRKQAARLAEEVQALGAEIVWTSPLDRAYDTAEIVASICGIPLAVDAGLVEIGAGRWIEDPVDGGGRIVEEDEDMDAATARVTSTLERILAEQRPFVAVTHLGPIRIACVVFGGEPWDRFGAIMPDNCRLVRFDRTTHGWTARLS